MFRISNESRLAARPPQSENELRIGANFRRFDDVFIQTVVQGEQTALRVAVASAFGESENRTGSIKSASEIGKPR